MNIVITVDKEEMWLLLRFLLLTLVVSSATTTILACQSCFQPRFVQHRRAHHHRYGISLPASTQVFPYVNRRTNPIAVTVTRRFLKLCKSNKVVPLAFTVCGMAMVQHLTAKQKLQICVWKNDGSNGQDQKENDEVDDEHRNEESQPSSSGVSSALIATIGIYKNFISPLLPPACRFVPTCSQYGVQALKEFGVSKGVILTSWRLLRCSPFGGKGYDPPKWPPPPYTYSSY